MHFQLAEHYVEHQHYARSNFFCVSPAASNISQQSFVVPSLLPLNTELNISGRLHSTHQIQLYIRDDIVGLENVESRTIVVSAVSRNCHNVQSGSTQVLIEDDDSKKLKSTLLTSHLSNDFIF